MIDSQGLRKLATLGLSTAQMSERLNALADIEEAEEQRKARQRERKARSRAKGSHGVTVTGSSRDLLTPPSSPEVSPQTPLPKPSNPKPSSPPKGGSSPTELEVAIAAYAEMAKLAGLPLPLELTRQRRRKLGWLLRQHGLAAWQKALGKVGASRFCRGDGPRGWTVNLDFLLKPDSLVKILEGQYDDRLPTQRAGPPRQKPQPIDYFRDYASKINEQDGSESEGGDAWNDVPGVSIRTIEHDG